MCSAFPATAGQVFQLVNAASRLGTFAAVNPPALPGGLAWTNQLAANGSIAVVAPVTPPQLVHPWVLGDGSFQFGFGHLAGASFTVLAATNVALPRSDWTVIGPAAEVLPGQFQFIDPDATNHAQRFYRVVSP